MRHGTWVGLLACGMLACTTSGDFDRTETSSSAPGEAPLLCEGCQLLQEEAGGETSEFSGGNPIHRISASAGRALSDPALASTLEWVEGRHELAFGWRPSFVTGEVSGYGEETSVVLEVRATSARDVQLDASPEQVLLLDLAVDITAADGSLRGTVMQTVALEPDRDQLSTRNVSGDWVGYDAVAYPLDNFRGSLDLGLDQALVPAGSLSVELAFTPEGVRGHLRPVVANASGEPWSPLDGFFPDDGCDMAQWAWKPVPMDGSRASLNGETLSALFERELQPWTGPLPATWYGGEPTQVNFVVGATQQACQAFPDNSPSNFFTVRAPLRVWSADGRLDVTRSAKFSFSASADSSPESRVSFDAPFVPAEQLSASGELGYPLLDTAVYAAPEIHFVYGDGGFEGRFHVETVPPTANPDTQWLSW
jgi:hypothetical protein